MAEREAEREAAHAAWRAQLLSGSEADTARLHTLGLSLVRAFGPAQDDDAALLFLAQLPVDERLKCAALSKRWHRLASVPSVYSHLRFDDALPGRLMTCGDDTSAVIAALQALLTRAGPALRSLDARALDAVWCKAQASRWPVLRAALLLHLLDKAAAAAAAGGQPRALEELRLSQNVPIVLATDLARVLPPRCPRMARLDCTVFLLLNAAAPGLLRRLPREGNVRLVLVKNKASSRTPRAAAALVKKVCAALGKAPAVTSVAFSFGYPRYMRQVSPWQDERRALDNWKYSLSGAVIAAVAKGLQAQQLRHRVRSLDVGEDALTADAVSALEALLRSCAGEACALKELDLRDATGLGQRVRKSLEAAAAAGGVTLQLSW